MSRHAYLLSNLVQALLCARRLGAQIEDDGGIALERQMEPGHHRDGRELFTRQRAERPAGQQHVVSASSPGRAAWHRQSPSCRWCCSALMMPTHTSRSSSSNVLTNSLFAASARKKEYGLFSAVP